MSDLTTFRDHCRRMATAEHKPECLSLGPEWPTWVADLNCMTLKWIPGPSKPTCDGCLTEADRALFAQMASEVGDYLADDSDVDLFGEMSEMPQTSEEPA